MTDKTSIPPPDWEALIGQIANEIMEEHSPQRILQVRAKLYDLLSHCIPPTTILKVFTSSLSKIVRFANLFSDTDFQADTED